MKHKNYQHWWVITTHDRYLDNSCDQRVILVFLLFEGNSFVSLYQTVKTNDPLHASERNHNLINNAKKMDIYRAQWFVWGTMLYWTFYISTVWHCTRNKKWHYLSMDYEDMNILSINGWKWSYARMFHLFPWNNMEAHFRHRIKKLKR